MSQVKARSPDTSISGRSRALAAASPLCQAHGVCLRHEGGRPRLGVKRGRSGPPLPPMTRGPCLGRPVGRKRHVTRRAALSPAGGPPVAPAGRVPPRSVGAAPLVPRPSEGGGRPGRKGKGKGAGRREQGAEPESRDSGAARKAPRRSLAPPFSCSCLSLLPGRAPA